MANMNMSAKNFSPHDFYCLNCGARNIPVFRSRGRCKEQFHRKKLYCPNCGVTCNHVEIRNDQEAYDFRFSFEAGDFIEEAKESISEVQKEEAIYDV
jgi:transcription elongation factor Elf1